MNYLPFDYQQIRDNRVGPFEPHIESNMAKAESYQQQLEEQRRQIQQLPSHYQFLRKGLYWDVEQD